MNLSIHPEAEAEYDAIYAYYERQLPGLGGDFAAETNDALTSICDFPLAWPEYELGTRRRFINSFHLGIIYAIGGNTIRIYAFMDQRRKPDYWTNRLK